jgi:SAM-dependent methyltransferase
MASRPRPSASARFWDAAARQNAAWHVANAYTEQNAEFFAQGARETDELLRLCGVPVGADDVAVEIGCGVGRMTARLAELARTVIATDVSAEMIAHARRNLALQANVALLVVPGDGSLPLRTATADVVFSYIVLQHVPTVDAQLRYLKESIRILRPGGRLAVQVRGYGMATRVHEWAGYAAHLFRGHHTLSRAWRGARVPRSQLLSLAGPDVTVVLRPVGRRHVWVVAHKH